MPNLNPKNALDRAGLTPDQFAGIISVDPRTVERWVAGRTPYPRHRVTIARALDLTEQELWPGPSPRGFRDRETIQDPDADALQHARVWSSLDDPDVPDPAAVIAGADGPIDVIDSSAWIGVDDELATVLAEHAGAAQPVRIICREPTRVLLPLIGQSYIEIRLTAGWTSCWLLRAGGTIVTNLTPVFDTDGPPLMAVEQSLAAGLFTRLADDFEDLWRQHDNVLKDPEQLDDWIEDDEEWNHEAAEEPPPAAPPQPPASEPDRDSGSGSRSDGEGRRRWPGRLS